LINAHIDVIDNPNKYKNNQETLTQEVPVQGILSEGKFKNLSKTKVDQQECFFCKVKKVLYFAVIIFALYVIYVRQIKYKQNHFNIANLSRFKNDSENSYIIAKI
jgi:hypothetical protein